MSKTKPWKLSPGRFLKSHTPEELENRKKELADWAAGERTGFDPGFIDCVRSKVGTGLVLYLTRQNPWSTDFNALGRLVKWYGTLEGTEHDKFMFELHPDHPRPGPNERWTKTLYSTVDAHLPELSEMCKNARKAGSARMCMHQEAWAAGLHEDEYTLLGIAAWYAALENTPLMIVGSCWSLEPGTMSQQIKAVITEAKRSGLDVVSRQRPE